MRIRTFYKIYLKSSKAKVNTFLVKDLKQPRILDVYLSAVAAARISAARKYGVSLRHRRFHYTRDLIRRNLAGTIDGNDRLVHYAIRWYFSRRPVTTRRRRNGERLDLRMELGACLFLRCLVLRKGTLNLRNNSASPSLIKVKIFFINFLFFIFSSSFSVNLM